MGRKIIVLHILIGFLTLCIGVPLDGVQSTSTSVSVSTVTRRVTSKSVSRPPPTKSFSLGTVAVTEEIPLARVSEPTSEESPKSFRIRKKILASNLKNITDRIVPPGGKHERRNLLKSVVNITEVSESKDSGKGSSSDSTEDDLVEDIPVKPSNITVEVLGNKTLSEEVKIKNGVEGRSLEDRSSEENINVNPKGKTKFQEQTTRSLEIQKEVKNNLLNKNESPGNKHVPKITRPSPSIILPNKKPPSISRDNSLKNSIRFDSEFYGPSGQTDWVPIVPDKLPVRSSSSQPFGNRAKHTSTFNRTTERNHVVFPSNGAFVKKESNAIPIRLKEVEVPSVRHRNSAERQGASNTTQIVKSTSTQQPTRLATKFRGTVRYRSPHGNATVDKIKNETILKKINTTTMEFPVTGSSWTLATLGGPSKTTEKSEETTEISVVSSTNHTTKSQNAVDNSLVVPPENVKVDNITKEQQQTLKNVISGINLDDATHSSFKYNATEIKNNLPKDIEGWLKKDGELTNQTVVDIPGSVDMHQNNESLPITGIMKTSAPELETTVATDEYGTTETVLDTTILNPSTENTVFMDTSSQSSVSNNTIEKFEEALENLSTTEEVKATVIPVTEPVISPTTLNMDSGESIGDSETTPEPEQTTNIMSSTESTPFVTSQAVTQKANISTKIVSSNTLAAITPVTPTTVEKSTTERVIASTQMLGIKSMPSTKAPVNDSVAEVSAGIKVPVVTQQVSTIMDVSTTPLTTITTTTTTTSTTPKIVSILTSSTTTTTAIPITTTPSISTTPSTTTEVRTTPSTTTTSTTTTTTTEATTTATKQYETKLEAATEEGIYYKNYIPTTMNPHEEITEENVPAYLRLTVQATSWEELCRLKEDLRESIIKMLGGKNVSSDAVHFLNLNDRNCQEKIEESRGEPTNGTIFLPVNMFLMDKNGDFDKNLSEAFLTTWGRRGLDFELPIRKVDFVTPIVNLTELADAPLGGSVVAAIVISCVAGICVILLGILFVIMKRRQKRFNYGQRCTPVSLDAYSLDSVSIYNSVRRKGMRASKRSYGNAAFDDPEIPTHPMNFAGLANFSSDKEQLYEEFNIIPQVYPKVEELPAGAETKNRYANIIPLPETRVHLTVRDGDPLSDYINANYVRGLKGAEKLYIACQAPMESTIEDFWRMVWEQQCKVILMLTDLQENGIEKCADYLPPNEVTDNLRLFGDFQVTLKKRDVKEKYIISNLKLKNMEANLWREVTHLWYLGWPDQGVPSEPNSLIAFLIEARSQMKIQNGATTSSPAVVHCSPGTGRTGTVIACDLCIREYEQSRMVDIPRCVFNIRRDRAGCVQTKDQYAFIYQVLNVYATKLSGGGIESI